MIKWLKKQRDILRKTGGLEEKRQAIELKNKVSSTILARMSQIRLPDGHQVAEPKTL